MNLSTPFIIDMVLGSERLSVALLSRELDVDHDVVLQIARASPSLVLLSEDKTNIITK
jgi:hypothetical protein